MPYAMGIYEKALPAAFSWQERFRAVKKAGYDFLELSIDESDWRLERLDWTSAKRQAFKDQAASAGIQVLSMCLSAQRKYPLGSQDPRIRTRSLEILHKALDLAADTGIQFILVPGYDVFYEESTPESSDRFLAGLSQAAALAEQAGILLALENTDKHITSIKLAKAVVDQLKSPWLKLYGDIGNLVALGHDLFQELQTGADQLAGIHIKDALPGVMRGVPLGQGIVAFEEMFRMLPMIGFNGPLMLEIWEDPGEEPLQRITRARKWIQQKYQQSLEDGR